MTWLFFSLCGLVDLAVGFVGVMISLQRWNWDDGLLFADLDVGLLFDGCVDLVVGFVG